jgi:metallo-beta-lactamase class B
MRTYLILKYVFRVFLVFLLNGTLCIPAQELPINPGDDDPQRTEFIEPFHMIDNIYYVGPTIHNSSYLFTSDEGHILIDATYDRFVTAIINNIEKLGFRTEDIKVILSNHAHPDHVEGLAAMREFTGATTMATAPDAEVIESGGMLDFRDREGDPYPWIPGPIDQIIEDGEIVRVGDIALKVHMTAGHTKGCTTLTTVVEEGGQKYDVVVLCAVRINTAMPLVNHPKYPNMPQDLAYTFARLKIMPVDIFLGPHGWIFGLQEKLERLKQERTANPFIDPEGFKNYILGREKEYLEIMKREMGY